ncbi:MAG: PilN domain-containing protein [Thermodesulfobacteriota bacterium]
MIRINLLPVRAAKKKETVRFQLTIAGLVIFFVVAATLLFFVSYSKDASALKKDIEAGKTELAMLKSKIGELAKLKGQKRVLEDKLKIVRKLEEAREGPVELFTRLSAAMPKKAWLKSMVEKNNSMTLVGVAAYDDIIADFMRNLKEQKFKNVELVIAKRAKGKTKMVDFTLKVDK